MVRGINKLLAAVLHEHAGWSAPAGLWCRVDSDRCRYRVGGDASEAHSEARGRLLSRRLPEAKDIVRVVLVVCPKEIMSSPVR